MILGDDGEFLGDGVSASVWLSNVYYDDESLYGPVTPLPLSQARVANTQASATMEADLGDDRINLRTYAAAYDPIAGDGKRAEANPDIRKLWFRVLPTGNESFGAMVDLNLGLAWQGSEARGVNVFATLTDLTGNSVARLTSRDDSETQRVLVGGYYRLDLMHTSLVNGGALLSAADFQASFSPINGLQPPTPLVPGDYTANGIVDAADYTTFRDSLNESYDFSLDSNGDGKLGGDDLAVWRAWYGQSLGAANALVVPEPASLWLAALVLGVRPRRNR